MSDISLDHESVAVTLEEETEEISTLSEGETETMDPNRMEEKMGLLEGQQKVI